MLVHTLLFILGAVAAQAQDTPSTNENCVRVTNSWFSVCNFTLYTCLVSDHFCAPFGDFRSLAENAPIRPSKKEPWTFLIDPYTRVDDTATCNDFHTCVNAPSNGLGKPSNPPPIKDWNFGVAIVEHSYLTIKPLTFSGQDPVERFHVQKRPPVTEMAQNSLCRCIEFMGDHISLQNMHCNVTACVEYFREDYQYKGDDGVLVAFSGPSAAFSNVTDCKLESKYFSDEDYENLNFRALTTGIRFGSDDAKAQVVDQVRIARNEFHDLDYAVSFWDVATQFPGESIFINQTLATCAPSAENKECVVTFKQAYVDSVPVLWNNTGGSEYQLPNPFLPTRASNWTLLNLSAVVPLSFAYLRPTAIRPHLDDHTCTSNQELTDAALGFGLGSLFFFITVSMLYECYSRSHDPYDDEK